MNETHQPSTVAPICTFLKLYMYKRVHYVVACIHFTHEHLWIWMRSPWSATHPDAPSSSCKRAIYWAYCASTSCRIMSLSF